MKTLKGLLTAVLILSMSTSFTALSANQKEMTQVNSQKFKIISYDKLSEAAQLEVDILVNDYCKAFYHYKKDSQKSYRAKRITGYTVLGSLGMMIYPLAHYATTGRYNVVTKAMLGISAVTFLPVLGGGSILWIASSGNYSKKNRRIEDRKKMTVVRINEAFSHTNNKTISYHDLEASLESICE